MITSVDNNNYLQSCVVDGASTPPRVSRASCLPASKKTRKGFGLSWAGVGVDPGCPGPTFGLDSPIYIN